jgi:hypothetical protein
MSGTNGNGTRGRALFDRAVIAIFSVVIGTGIGAIFWSGGASRELSTDTLAISTHNVRLDSQQLEINVLSNADVSHVEDIKQLRRDVDDLRIYQQQSLEDRRRLDVRITTLETVARQRQMDNPY